MKGKHGGAREGGGRKSKSEELALIERLTPMVDDAFKALQKGVKEGNYYYVKMFMEYMYGKPKETSDVKLTVDKPIIIDWFGKYNNITTDNKTT